MLLLECFIKEREDEIVEKKDREDLVVVGEGSFGEIGCGGKVWDPLGAPVIPAELTGGANGRV